MPVKKDASGKRRVELEFIVPGRCDPQKGWAIGGHDALPDRD
jgi:hypothetical protein